MRAWGRLAGVVVWLAAMPSVAHADALKVTSVKQLDPRLEEVRAQTSALPGPATIRVLLPAGYAQQPRRRWPVLYLLHGTSGGASDWTVKGDAEKVTAGLAAIVVMPDIALNDDGGGWCTNWPNGKYRWETFHIDQLIPWVDATFRTRRDRAGRAIAGLSQGGFCSMSYAARHPDLFATALSYSGAPDTAWDADAVVGTTAIINATEVGLDGEPPNSMFGDRATNEINWAAHDPATLAPNLAATRLYLWSGNGQPGPFDGSSPNPGGMAIEAAAWRDTTDFHARLESLGIPSFFDDYGPGTHSWPYWTRDLQQSIAPLTEAFAHPSPAPSAISYTSADDAYSVYGWRVTTHRTAREFGALGDASCRGFVLSGSGSATVTTPPCLRRGAGYRITLSGDRVAPRTVTVRVPRSRRVTLDVPLGPPNPYQQDTAQAYATGTAVYRTRVTIARRA